MADILKGKPVADQLQAELVAKVTELRGRGLEPHLAVLLVGSDPASEVYMNRKKKTGEKLGFVVTTHVLPGDSSTAAVLAKLEQLNADSSVHGILVEQPLPDQIDKELIVNTVAPAKDVDGANPVNLGRLVGGDESFVPATAQAVIEMLERIAAGDPGAGPIAALEAPARFHWLVAPSSTTIQSSPVHCGLTAEPAVTLDRLFDRLVLADA